MHIQDRFASRLVGKIDDDAPVEAPRPQQGAIEDVGLIGRREHDDAFAAREAVHLGQDLVQRLLLLRRPADRHRPARAPDRVELVDEDDRRRVFARLLEQVAHARGADADDHLDEFGGAHREERNAGLARDSFGEQRLAGARRPDEQHALRRRTSEPRVLRRIAQEIDDLDQLVLRLVDPRDVGERDLRVRLLVEAARLALADAHQAAAEAAGALRAAKDPDVEPDQQQRGAESVQQRRQRAAALVRRLRADLDAVLDQELLETLVVKRRQCRDEIRRRARRTAPRHATSLFLRRACLRVVRRRKRHRRDEAAAERLAAAVDRLHVALGDFFLEQRVRNGERRLLTRHEQADRQEVDEQRNGKPQPRATRRHERAARPGTRTRRLGIGRPSGWSRTANRFR